MIEFWDQACLCFAIFECNAQSLHTYNCTMHLCSTTVSILLNQVGSTNTSWAGTLSFHHLCEGKNRLGVGGVGPFLELNEWGLMTLSDSVSYGLISRVFTAKWGGRLWLNE